MTLISTPQTGRCAHCGHEMPHHLLKWKVFQATSGGGSTSAVCGQCFMTVDIHRLLKEIHSMLGGIYGESRRPGIQVVGGDEPRRASGTNPPDTSEPKNPSEKTN